MMCPKITLGIIFLDEFGGLVDKPEDKEVAQKCSDFASLICFTGLSIIFIITEMYF